MKPTVVFLGSSENSVIVLESLYKYCSVPLVITLPDRVLGRKKVLTQNPVKAAARSTEIVTTEKITQEIIEKVKEIHPDFVVVADFGLILPQSFLDIPKYAPLNVHPSLLPKYRGPSPVQATLLAGDAVTGVTIICMSAMVDQGAILGQEKYRLSEKETTGSLLPILFTQGSKLLETVITAYTKGTQKEVTQDESMATFTNRFTKEDGFVDLLYISASELDRKIRAFFPWPGVWTKVTINNKERILKLLPANMVQLEGKQPMKIRDFFNGYPSLEEKLKILEEV